MASSIKFAKHIKELRILLCQTSQSSNGVREFLQQSYVPLKKNNPQFPILVRECSGIQPKMIARYEFGREKSVGLNDASANEVLDHLKSMSQDAH